MVEDFEFKIEFPEFGEFQRYNSVINDAIEYTANTMSKMVDDAFFDELKKYPIAFFVVNNIKCRFIQKMAVKTTGLHLVHFEGQLVRTELWKNKKLIKRIL